MFWPDNKDFAFTIIDDTDNSVIDNISPIYKLLNELNIKTTKSVWIFPSRDKFKGQTIQDEIYRNFVLDIQGKGFEIALHNVGSGNFIRSEIKEGINLFKNYLGAYPKMHINHSQNKDNLYWGSKRFGPILSFIHKLYQRDNSKFEGDIEVSDFFWGDICKEYITYVRNRVFNGINTLAYDPYMPYKEKGKAYVNYWFSASDGHTIEEFLSLTTQKNIDKLVKEKGLCIVYTHFASGFVTKEGDVDQRFKEQMEYFATKNGWFAPASTILDYIKSTRNNERYLTNIQSFKMDVIWLFQRIQKRLKFNR
jgi:hypothetical protein